jgi:hypothetical protein
VFIIDTLTAFSNFKLGEGNDSGVVQARGQALKQLLVDNPDLAIVILHHLRKEFNGRGRETKVRTFADIANSYALRAMTDMNILIYQPSSNKEHKCVRALKIEGRFVRGEEKQTVELSEDGKSFSLCTKKIEEDFGAADNGDDEVDLFNAFVKDPSLNELSEQKLHAMTGIPLRAIRSLRQKYPKGTTDFKK